MPSVSICIPTYEPNLGYLRELLGSIAAVPPTLSSEVIVSDDSSSNYAEVERLVREVIPAAIVSRSEHRLGMVGNWNRAVRGATGDYVLLPGQDDLVHLVAVTALIGRAQAVGADLAFGSEQYIAADGRQHADPRRGPTVDQIWSAGERRDGVLVDARICLLFGGVLGDPCAAVIRRSALERLGGFSSSYGHSADTEMWMRISASGSVVLLADLPTSTRRIHDDNATAHHVRTGIAGANRSALLQSYGSVMPRALQHQAAARLHLHHVWDVVRTPALARTSGGRPAAKTSVAGMCAAIAVDLRLSSALRSCRLRFESAATP